MGDVDERNPVVALERQQALENRGAQRRIDHRHRLVGKNQLRPQEQRAGHLDALALAAAELVRIAAEHVVWTEAHGLQRPLDLLLPSLRDEASLKLLTGTVST